MSKTSESTRDVYVYSVYDADQATGPDDRISGAIPAGQSPTRGVVVAGPYLGGTPGRSWIRVKLHRPSSPNHQRELVLPA